LAKKCIVYGDAVGDPGRVIDRHDEGAGFRDPLQSGHIEIEIEHAADIFHRRSAIERRDPVGHIDSFAVMQNAIEKRLDERPGPAVDQFLAALGNQVIDDVGTANGVCADVCRALRRRRFQSGLERNGARLADVADIRHNRDPPVGDNGRRTCQKSGQVTIAHRATKSRPRQVAVRTIKEAET
jgi:hypothetical protein